MSNRRGKGAKERGDSGRRRTIGRESIEPDSGEKRKTLLYQICTIVLSQKLNQITHLCNMTSLKKVLRNCADDDQIVQSSMALSKLVLSVVKISANEK